jgi:hypothetical protein
VALLPTLLAAALAAFSATLPAAVFAAFCVAAFFLVVVFVAARERRGAPEADLSTYSVVEIEVQNACPTWRSHRAFRTRIDKGDTHRCRFTQVRQLHWHHGSQRRLSPKLLRQFVGRVLHVAKEVAAL